MKRLLTLALCLTAVSSLHGQLSVQSRRATMTGSRGTNGKCTIEVRVDGVAEVEISGDSGRLRTISGQPATWTRMECSDPLPRNMADFRFRGVDGRGRQTLIQDPRNGRGVAVVQIEDSKGGSEGYTFDLEWSGSSGGPGGFGGGFSGGRGNFSAERAIDICRDEVRARAERDYGIRGMDITSIAADNNPGRRDWITGTFTDRRGPGRESYRFGCSVDFSSGRVRNVEISRAGGGPIPRNPGLGANPRNAGAAIRTCQDAVVQRINRDGYRDINFGRTAVDDRPGRNDWIVGNATARRGPVTDRFEFGCSVDFDSGRVRSVDVSRR